MTDEKTIKAWQESATKLLADVVEKRTPYEGRDADPMPQETVNEIERMLDEADDLQEKITVGQKAVEAMKRVDAFEEWAKQPVGRPPMPAGDPETDADRDGIAARKAFGEWLKNGSRALNADTPEVKALKAFQADSDVGGGYLIAPRMVTRGLIETVDDMTYIRQLAEVISIDRGQSLGSPVRENDLAAATWGAELDVQAPQEAPELGFRELNPQLATAQIKLSMKQLAAPGIDPERLWLGRMAYQFSVLQEEAFLTGDGAGKPLGLMVASNSGIPTSRDVSTGNSSTAITFDGLIEAMYSVKTNYWGMCRWMFSRAALKQIRRLKDGDNQFLWQPSNQAGQPGMILGYPFILNEFMPDTFTSGLYVGLWGDFSKYRIVDSMQFMVQRLDELYATTNEVGFIGRLETDGMPVLAEAFARVTLA